LCAVRQHVLVLEKTAEATDRPFHFLTSEGQAEDREPGGVGGDARNASRLSDVGANELAMSFLDAKKVSTAQPNAGAPLSTAELAERASEFIQVEYRP
jgi:hypothetical protein